MAKFISLVKYTSKGAISTETLHAFPEEERLKVDICPNIVSLKGGDLKCLSF